MPLAVVSSWSELLSSLGLLPSIPTPAPPVLRYSGTTLVDSCTALLFQSRNAFSYVPIAGNFDSLAPVSDGTLLGASNQLHTDRVPNLPGCFTDSNRRQRTGVPRRRRNAGHALDSAARGVSAGCLGILLRCSSVAIEDSNSAPFGSSNGRYRLGRAI